jgi:hypothetical protein
MARRAGNPGPSVSGIRTVSLHMSLIISLSVYLLLAIGDEIA